MLAKERSILWVVCQQPRMDEDWPSASGLVSSLDEYCRGATVEAMHPYLRFAMPLPKDMRGNCRRRASLVLVEFGSLLPEPPVRLLSVDIC